MTIRLTDKDIERLIQEPKPVPADWRDRLTPRPKRGHAESLLDVVGRNGSQFRVMVRQSVFNPLDFSVILGIRIESSTAVFRLRRYNGKSHEHSNPIEGQSFYGFHIHQATERYQEYGEREDFFAVPTDRYGDLDGALQSMIDDCGFEPKGPYQPDMFAARGEA